MTRRTKKWVIGIAAAALTVLVALSVVGYVLARRFEPYIRDQVVSYLHDRRRRPDHQIRAHVDPGDALQTRPRHYGAR